jgi:hypothetical protein|tara:strand:- start:2664 stop:2909 length:246 start_codon:yes stop_codon:yes gene_type:complete
MRVPVKMPNGKVLTASVGGLTGGGYRVAYVRVEDTSGAQVSVSGRVTTRHGYAGQTLPFEVNMNGVNAIDAFRADEALYSK